MAKSAKTRVLRKLCFYIFIPLCLLLGCAIIAANILVSKFEKDLPEIDALINYKPSIVTSVFDDEENLLVEFSKEKRIKVEVGEIPSLVKNAFVAAEDENFFKHKGVSPKSILRAAIANMKQGKKAQGGSTITQQVAKTFFLSPERSYTRKFKEALLSFRIEKAMTKDEIMNRYLNHIYFGNNAYGVAAAAKTYFGKNLEELTIAEAAILGGIPVRPSDYNPLRNPEKSKDRQSYVLSRLHKIGFINSEEFEAAKVEEVLIKNRKLEQILDAPYAAEHVRRYLEKTYGEDALYEGGLQVYTTFNLKHQIAAQKALDKGLNKVDRRLGLRQPSQVIDKDLFEESFEKAHQKIIEEHFDHKIFTVDGELKDPETPEDQTPLKKNKIYEAILTGFSKSNALEIQVGHQKGSIRKKEWKWIQSANSTEVYKSKIVRNPIKQLKIGSVLRVKYLKKEDFSLEQSPLVQGALLSYRLPSGAIDSMVGGYNFYETRSSFNRAVQAVRQPGSTFKPFVYGAALAEGFSPASIIVDSPIVFKTRSEKSGFYKMWKPDNYNSKSYGDTSLRSAIAQSRNIPTIKILQHLGIPKVIAFSRKLGIKGKLNEDLSLALGSNSLKMSEFLKAWGVFANKGREIQPYFIKRIVDREGVILEEHETKKAAQIISPALAFLITDILQSVVQYGTGSEVRKLGRAVAGKTGTTSEYKDALFYGYTPELLTGVWVGFDESHSVGRQESGNKSAGPIWVDYMKVALEGTPKKSFRVPAGIQRMSVSDDQSESEKLEFFMTEKLHSKKSVVITGNPHLEHLVEEDNIEDDADDVLRNEY